MEVNVLKDINWICTTQGFVSPVEAMRRAHESDFILDFNKPGYEVSATFRFLLSLSALVLRHEESIDLHDHESKLDLIARGFSDKAIERACFDVEQGADIFGEKFPFMQRPALPPTSAKDTSRRLGPGDQEIKKLLPAMPSEQGEDYWNLSVSFPKRLPLEDAVLKLVLFHYYSMAGNNAYDGNKARMGAPGIRFLGKGNTATEFMWACEGESFLYSLLASLPMNWVEGEGLPAWADREGMRSRSANGTFHPLWSGTWSSNTAVCYWEENGGKPQLAGVRVGGVPDNWLPIPYDGKKSETLLKEWWDLRNESDPMYLYCVNKYGDGSKKAQRIDFGRDGLDIAVEWAAEEKLQALISSGNANVLLSDGDERKPIFFRHQIEGTASSPSIRASQVFYVDPAIWAFGLSSDDSERVTQDSQLIRTIHNKVTGVFRRRNKTDESAEAKGKAALVLDALEESKADASAAYWRYMEPVYEDYMTAIRNHSDDSVMLYDNVIDAAMKAFDDVTTPYLGQYPQQIYSVRSVINRMIRAEIREYRTAPNRNTEGN